MMKHLKKIIYPLLVLLVLVSCEDERDLAFVDQAALPIEIEALYDITQDNTGLVTITPNARNAVSFEVYFGDETEDPAELLIGEGVDHIYAEGTYTIRIVAFNINGESNEVTQQLIVSFQAPSNLVVAIENDANISKRVNVAVNADFAAVYDFYTGDPAATDPITANIGESISYVYPSAGIYSVRVVARGAAIETTEWTQDFEVTEILEPLVAAPDPSGVAPIDAISLFSDEFTDVPVDTWNTVWSQANFEDVDIDGNQTKKYTGLNFNGIETVGNPVDASGMEFIHLDIWTPNITEFRVKLVDFLGDGFGGANGDTEAELTFNPALNEWVSLDIPLSDFTNAGMASLSDLNQYVISSAPAGEGIVFIDNVYFWRTPSVFNDVPVNFEDPNLDYTFTGFGDPGFGPIPTAIIANPDQSGINITNTVLEIQKPAGSQVWAGAAMPLANPIDFTNNGTTITIKVWSPRVGVPILFKTEDLNSPPDGNGNPSVFAEVIATTTKANEWEELSFDMTTFTGFSTAIDYGNVIIFPDFNSGGQGETFYFDDIEFASIKFPVNFETGSLTYNWIGFGDPGFGPIPTAIVANPDASGINTSGTVLEVQKPAGSQVWAGASLALDGVIDFDYGTTVKIKVWSPKVGAQILFKTEDLNSPPDGNGNPSVFAEIIATTTVANQWEELTFDLTAFGSFSTSIEYGNLIVFPDFGTAGQGDTFYFDDFILTNN